MAFPTIPTTAASRVLFTLFVIIISPYAEHNPMLFNLQDTDRRRT